MEEFIVYGFTPLKLQCLLKSSNPEANTGCDIGCAVMLGSKHKY